MHPILNSISSSLSISCPPVIPSPDAAVAFQDREYNLSNSEEVLIRVFFTDIKFTNPEIFLTQDVKNDPIFMKFLKSLVYSWNEFSSLEKKYVSSRSTLRKPSTC